LRTTFTDFAVALVKKSSKFSGVTVVIALKLQHSKVIRCGHHIDELNGRETNQWVRPNIVLYVQ